MDHSKNSANLIDASGHVNASSPGDLAKFTGDNKRAWDAIANDWEVNQSPEVNGKADDGNDMFTQCLLPVVDELVCCQDRETVLDLGAGSGILARRFANMGAVVTGLDFSEAMLKKARERYAREREHTKGSIEYGQIDLMDYEAMIAYMQERKRMHGEDNYRFDIITISTTLKSLPSLEPIAKALPEMLKPKGRIVVVDLHPAFSKPAGHRGMEIFEDPATGKQQLSTYIKVPKYLNIPPCLSEAVRGQPEPLWVFHRPFWSLMQPFFNNKLVLDAMREPAFEGKPDISQAQSYHNFQQTPMLLAFRLLHAPK